MFILLGTIGVGEKMTLPKVLVGIVTYEGKSYVDGLFYDNILKLSYPNHDVMIVDNSATKKYSSKLKKRFKKNKNYLVEHVNRGSNSREAQAKSLNKLREVFLAGDYDYLMLIESDLIPPRDIIERLISHQVSVVGSIYLIGYANSKEQPPRPCLFGVKNDEVKGIHTFNYPPSEGFAFFGNGLIQVHGCGFGSTLIKRRIIEEFKFWYDLNPPIKHSDVLFYMDLHNNGIPIYVDSNLIIPHYNSNWNEVLDK